MVKRRPSDSSERGPIVRILAFAAGRQQQHASTELQQQRSRAQHPIVSMEALNEIVADETLGIAVARA